MVAHLSKLTVLLAMAISVLVFAFPPPPAVAAAGTWVLYAPKRGDTGHRPAAKNSRGLKTRGDGRIDIKVCGKWWKTKPTEKTSSKPVQAWNA
jgi:hypothetical protein